MRAVSQSMNRDAVPHGFTLIELIVAITLTGIVVSFVAMFIVIPVESYQAQARRAELVDGADGVFRNMGRDLRAALPNSVRTLTSGSIWALEMLAASDAVRYRESGETADASQQLDFTSPDISFATLSQFDGITRPFTTTQYYLSIYNVGVPGADAYQLANVITLPGTGITIDSNTSPNEDKVTLSAAFKFLYDSPGHRVYLVSGPVTYLCDTVAQTIKRYSGYSINASQNNRASDAQLIGAGATSSLIADNISACQFTYTAGTAQRAGLVSLQITISNSGESVWLLHQVHVENAP